MLGLAKALVFLWVAKMGGWAVVTVKDLPEYFVAGQQYTVEFQVRQHGSHLLSQLEPRLLVRTSDRKDETSVPAVARSEGTYAATFTAPSAERVFLTIKSGFMNSDLRLYPQPVVTAGASRSSMADADRGRVLFVAKGCNTCHANADLTDRPDNQEIAVGPALGGRRLARELVVQKLTQPASQVMPDLGLTQAEVLALAAFIAAPQGASTGR